MTEQQHVPVEDLAAYAAGDLDAAVAVTVEAHLVLCAECRSDVEAVRAATAALASAPAVTMPPEVAARLDTALAGLGAATREPAGTVLPMAPRRKRRVSMAGISAVAAAVALGAAVSIPLLSGGSADNAPTAGSAPEAARDLSAKSTRRISSGLDYRRDSLATTLTAALAGRGPGTAYADSATDGRTQAGGNDAPPQNAPAAGAPETTLTTRSLRTEAARLAACVTELVGEQPPAGRTLLVADFALFEGREALVLVFPSVTREGVPRDNRVDVFVVGGGCGTEPGGDVLDFQRIAVPAGL